jgi:cellobiose transport system permease protein
MSAISHPAAQRRHKKQRAVARRFQQAGPFTYLFLILVMLLSIFPLYWSLVVASHDNSAIGAYPPVMTPGGNLFHNIHRLFGGENGVSVDFTKAFINSAIIASVVTVSVVFFSALAGFAFAKLEFRGRKLLFLLVLATLIVPVQLGLIPLYIEMKHFGWLNSIKAVIAPNLVTAFGVFLMRQYIVGAVPNDLIAAARVDGCNTWRVFWHVVMPAVRPIAAVLGLLTFMNTWNDFLWPFVVLNSRNPTIQVAIAAVHTVAYIPDYSLILTATFISILPLLVVFLVLGKQIIGGIMQGAVKG